jgi:hypothetical protein
MTHLRHKLVHSGKLRVTPFLKGGFALANGEVAC